jgi:putative transposase
MKLKAHHHCLYNLNYHLVLVTKYRRKCFTPDILLYLKEIFQKLSAKWEIEILEFNGEQDHVHLLLATHPNIKMSTLVNNFKTVSSRLVRKKFSKHLSNFYWKPVLWTRAYCLITTGGAILDIIKKYIEKQDKIT